MPNPGDIIGYYGCGCHPYKTWEECEFYHNQKLEVKDKVKERCDMNGSKTGTITKVHEIKGYYEVRFGKYPCDLRLRHAAELIKIV